MISKLLRTPLVWGFLLLAYSIGLGSMSVPLTGDQKVYLSIALEMRERASILIPYLFGQANFLKPPFQYWMTLTGWKVFGFSLFGALFPSVIALLSAAYFTRRLSKSYAYLPAIFFAGTLGTLTYGTTAQMEIWIVAFYLAAWNFSQEQKWFSAFAVVGAMSWIKGPLYPVLWVMSQLVYFTLNQDFSALKKSRFWFGLSTGVLIGMSWFAAAALKHREAMLEVFFGRENFGKLQTAQGSIQGLWGEFIFSLFPVVFVVAISLFDVRRRELFSSRWKFWTAYSLLPALFFTLFPYRVNSYLYLLTPLAIWFIPTDKLWVSMPVRRLFTLLSGFSCLMLLALVLRFYQGHWIGLELALPLGCLLLLFPYLLSKLHLPGLATASLLLVNLIRLSAVEMGERDLSGLREFSQTHSQLAYLIEPEHQDIWHEFGLVSSALGIEVNRLPSASWVNAFVGGGGGIIYSDEQQVPTYLQCHDWIRLKRRLKISSAQASLRWIRLGRS